MLGRHFCINRDADNYELSRATKHIEHFLSHDWEPRQPERPRIRASQAKRALTEETQRRDKFLALLWAFNARAAVLATALVSVAVGVMRIYGVFGALDHWWTAPRP